ncbi:MAG TPA: dihydrolipoamide acetyltransferase family protein [Solirubrobacterales bacterium]|nr:dihydrolipoamide acetyltransferase family protein [Solirubrobacterales bacterium]
MPETTATDIAMPRLSDSMEEGTILTWLKQVGDEVAVGEEIAEIETDKANMAYEADVAGTLLEILVAEGETAPVGATIARVGDPDAAPAAAEEPTEPEPETSEPRSSNFPQSGKKDERAPEAAAAQPATNGHSASGGERVKASPLARRIAREAGIDLGRIQGSGPGGRIVKKDVEAAEAAGAPAGGAGAAPQAAGLPPSTQQEEGGRPAAPAPAAGTTAGTSPTETAKGQVEVEELSKLQETVARRMAESKATAPHFYLTTEVDMGAAVAARARIKEISGEGDVVPSFNDMVVKACAIALRRFPRANGAYRDGRFELYSRVNVGIAVAARDALVVPTVFDADRKGLREIAADARALAAKVRDATITPPELSGATFTVSNLGMFGIRSFDAVINSPQAAILAVGEIAERPAVRDGEVVAAQLMNLTLSVDHRILYGAEGAEFLAAVKGLLEEPIALAL